MGKLQNVREIGIIDLPKDHPATIVYVKQDKAAGKATIFAAEPHRMSAEEKTAKLEQRKSEAEKRKAENSKKRALTKKQNEKKLETWKAEKGKLEEKHSELNKEYIEHMKKRNPERAGAVLTRLNAIRTELETLRNLPKKEIYSRY